MCCDLVDSLDVSPTRGSTNVSHNDPAIVNFTIALKNVSLHKTRANVICLSILSKIGDKISIARGYWSEGVQKMMCAASSFAINVEMFHACSSFQFPL